MSTPFVDELAIELYSAYGPPDKAFRRVVELEEAEDARLQSSGAAQSMAHRNGLATDRSRQW
jgi:hypothetical protein